MTHSNRTNPSIIINTVVLPRQIRFSEENPIYFLCFITSRCSQRDSIDEGRRKRGEKKEREEIKIPFPRYSLFHLELNFSHPSNVQLKRNSTIINNNNKYTIITIIINKLIPSNLFSCIDQTKGKKEVKRSTSSSSLFRTINVFT